MTRSKAGRTASGASAIKCAEQFVPPSYRLVDDPLVLRLLPAPLRWMMTWQATRNWFVGMVEKEAPGTYGGLVCRTRFVDDAVRASVGGGITSVVILGAGLDTRAYRLPELAGVEVREVDLPDVLSFKRQKLRRIVSGRSVSVRYVPIDFNQLSIDKALSNDGLRKDRPSLFIWEGVSQYLEPRSALETMAFVGQCAPGSRLAFTYVPAAIINGAERPPGAAETIRRMERSGHPWRCGFEPTSLTRTLADLGLELLLDADRSYYTEKYLEPVQRQLTVFELERAALAEVPASRA